MAAKSSDTNLRIPYGQAVHDELEEKRILSVLREKRTIMGREIKEFERRVAKFYGKKYGVMVNSGSSANLLAIELLNLPSGSEVITPVLTFSTTVAPLIQKGLVPVFADVIPGTYIIDIDKIEGLITKKTKVLMIPLLMGNVPDMKRLKSIAKKHKLYFIEDSCDTFAATYAGRPTGTYSDISTTSFYGSHIITAGGNGGIVLINDKKWYERAQVLRGWGRTSSLFGESEDIKKRFSMKIGNIQYDAKFIFDEIGYNFLPNEMGAAFGNVQLDKLPKFRKTREKNFATLFAFFKKYEDYFILPVQDKKARTQWLGFALTIKPKAPFTRLEIMTYLEKHNIQTRPIFTGNILKQPGYKNMKSKGSRGGYPATDHVMKSGFVFGCHHGLEDKHMNKLKAVFDAFFKKTLR